MAWDFPWSQIWSVSFPRVSFNDSNQWDSRLIESIQIFDLHPSKLLPGNRTWSGRIFARSRYRRGPARHGFAPIFKGSSSYPSPDTLATPHFSRYISSSLFPPNEQTRKGVAPGRAPHSPWLGWTDRAGNEWSHCSQSLQVRISFKGAL